MLYIIYTYMYTHAYTSLNIYIYIDMLHFHMWLKFKNSIQFAFIFKRSSAASSHKLGNWVARRKSTKNNFVRFKVRWRPLMKRPWIGSQGMEIPRDLKKMPQKSKITDHFRNFDWWDKETPHMDLEGGNWLIFSALQWSNGLISLIYVCMFDSIDCLASQRVVWKGHF